MFADVASEVFYERYLFPCVLLMFLSPPRPQDNVPMFTPYRPQCVKKSADTVVACQILLYLAVASVQLPPSCLRTCG